MPILLKKIEANIISLFGAGISNNFTAPAQLLLSVVGETDGIDDYIKLSSFESVKQDFSYVTEASFCEETPINFGLNTCSVNIELDISYD